MENSDSDLDDLRRSLDDLDADLMRLLAERFRLTERVGQHKQAHDLPPPHLQVGERRGSLVKSEMAGDGDRKRSI